MTLSTESPEDPQAAPPVSTGLKAQAASGAIWVSLESICTQLVSLAIFAVIAHYISPEDFGLISISFVVLQTLRPIILEGIAHYIILRPTSTSEDYSTAFWMTIAASCFAFGIMFFLSDPAESFFHAPGLAKVMRAMSLITLFAGLSRTHEVWLTKHFQFRSLALRSFVGTLLGGLVGAILATLGYGVDALVVQQLVNSIVALALLWVVCPWRPRFQLSTKTAIDIFNFQIKVLGKTIFWLVNQNCDTFLVAYFYGPAEAGIYALAKRLRLALQLAVSSPMSYVLTPALASAADDPARLNRLMMRALAMICAVCAPLYLGAAAIAHPAIALFFGAQWQGVAPFFGTLCVAILFGAIVDYNDLLLLLRKKQALSTVCQLLYLVLSITIFFIAQKAGIANYALPFALPFIIVLPVSIALLSVSEGIKPMSYAKRVLPAFASAIIMVSAIVALSYETAAYSLIVQLIILITVGVPVYILMLWTVDRATFDTLIDTGFEVLSPLIRKLKARLSRYSTPLTNPKTGDGG